ncbi:hypothetical protein D9M68_511230 [compost metagenome]
MPDVFQFSEQLQRTLAITLVVGNACQQRMGCNQRIREAQVLDERREYQQQALGFLAFITLVQRLGQLHRSQSVAIAVAPP